MKKIIRSYFSPFANIALPLWFALAATMVNAVASAIAVFISLYMAAQLHQDVSNIGLVMGALGAGNVVGAYLGGYLSDKVSSARICITSLLMNGVLLILLTQGTTLTSLFMIVPLLGAVNTAFTPANRVMLLQCCEESRRTQISGIRYMLYNFGFGLGILVYGLMADVSYHLTFIVSGLIVLSIASLLFFYRTYFDVPLRKNEVTVVESASRVDVQLWLLYLTLLAMGFIFSQLRSTYAIYLTTVYHLSTPLFSYLFLMNSALIVLVQVQLLHFLRNWNQNLLAGLGALLVGLSMSVLLLGDSYYLAIFSMLLCTIGEILFFSTLQVLIFNRAHESQKGKQMGVYQVVSATTALFGPVIGGYVYHFFNGGLLWTICGVMGVICFVIYRGLGRLEVCR